MDATHVLELSQATQHIKFLEDQRKKDTRTIAVLQEQLRNQEQQLTQQGAQIQELQTAMAGAQDLIAHAAEFEQIVADYKNEISLLFDKREKAWRKEQTETNRLHEIDMKALGDRIQELSHITQTLNRIEQQIQARIAEEDRLNETVQRLTNQVTDLVKRSDDRVQSVTYLEEQRRSDNRRIADLEQETTEQRKKSENYASKLLLLEDTLQKQRSRIEEAVQEVKGFHKPLEEMRVAEFRREQAVKKYTDQAEEVRRELEEWRSQTQRFVEQFQKNKRALETLEGFQARQEKRQNEVAEMQRLAEDRIKRQWEEWQVAMDKDLKRRQLVAEENWRQQEETNQEHVKWLERIDARAEMHAAHIESLLESRKQDALRTIEINRPTIEQVEQILAELRGLVEFKRD